MVSVAPEVSVIMPTFNRAWCLAEAVESVMCISTHAVELLVVDDGSTDDTPALLHELQAAHGSRMRVLRHAGGVNLGIAASRNLAAAEAKAPLLAFLDSDDWFLPRRFDAALPWLGDHPHLDAAIEPYENEVGGALRTEFHLTQLPPDGDGRAPALEAMLERSLSWTVPAITLRRSAFMRFGGFNERFRLAEDTALWLRFAAARTVGVAQSVLPVARVRRHAAHSWSGVDPEGAWRIYLDALADAVHWCKRPHSEIDAHACRQLRDRLRSYLIETLTREPGGRIQRLQAWWHATRAAPGLMFDRAVVANLGRRLLAA